MQLKVQDYVQSSNVDFFRVFRDSSTNNLIIAIPTERFAPTHMIIAIEAFITLFVSDNIIATNVESSRKAVVNEVVEMLSEVFKDYL